MKNKVSYRIRKLRESKDLKQKNLADELDITESAYSKIETGKTDPSVGRLEQIAKILGVGVTYFFQDTVEALTLQEPVSSYGFAKTSEIEEITKTIKQLKHDIAILKKEITSVKANVQKRRK